jgi:hypothetical protein
MKLAFRIITKYVVLIVDPISTIAQHTPSTSETTSNCATGGWCWSTPAWAKDPSNQSRVDPAKKGTL